MDGNRHAMGSDAGTDAGPDAAAEPAARVAVWRMFDPAWYLSRYPEAADHMQRLGIADPEAYYWSHGGMLGHSPNMFFDESWYLDAYPDVAAHVAAGGAPNGFSHYIHDGHRGRSPHWLFDEYRYRALHKDLEGIGEDPAGYANGYDHFLAAGDAEGRSGHRLFDHALYRANVSEDEETSQAPGGCFRHFLRDGRAGNVRLSWYFDPDWYLRTYPEVAREIENGPWVSALHHYMRNRMPWRYCPNEWFSEEYYGATYQDASAEVRDGRFRNNYDHFIRFGAAEGRNPIEGVDLADHLALPRTRAEIARGPHRDVFAHWVATRDTPVETFVPATEAQSKHLFNRMAMLQLSQFARHRLDFCMDGPPALSVLVVMHNQFALTMNALASLRGNYRGAIELILVDSGSSDQSTTIGRFVSGAILLRFDDNIGFLRACNAALAVASGPAVLFLNNDVLLGAGAIERALSTLRRERGIGALGGRIVRTDGTLQEAGCIIWRDGGTSGFLRDADPDLPEANVLRDVDFCSAVFLLVRADCLRALGGFDPVFAPAYYEETDLCVRLWKAGYRVVYDPRILVQHLEFGSSGAVESEWMIARNHQVFVERHRDWLQYQPSRDEPQQMAANRRARRAGRILMIEDRVPMRDLGSGFVRSNDLVRCMSELGYAVTLYPVYPVAMSLIEVLPDFPDDVEIIRDRGMDDLAGFLQARPGHYDLVWIGRTHNLQRLQTVLDDAASVLPQRCIVLDTEAVAAPRLFRQMQLEGRPSGETLDAMLRQELAVAERCRKIIAVNAVDAELIRRTGHGGVAVLGHMHQRIPTSASWQGRSGILFVGALHDAASPNYDSLRWFLSEVLPRLVDRLAPEVRFAIAGYVAPGIDPGPLGSDPRVDLLGRVDDLAALYDRHRVFVAPTRFAGGIPFKVHEAAAHGLPVVASTLLCNQVGWVDGQDILDGGDDDPERFADRIASVYADEALWYAIRDGALSRIGLEHDPDQYRARLGDILEGVLAEAQRSA